MEENEKRKTALTAYVGLGKDFEKLKVQKARPLLDIVRLGLELEELKLFDTFLGRINSYNDNICTVTFTKSELEKLFGVKRIRPEKLEKYLYNLMQPVRIKDDNKILLINLFSTAMIEKDDSGVWNITMTCSYEARKYIFKLTDIGYLKYNLTNVTVMGSKYSYILYLYLKENEKCRTWSVPLCELKAKIGCTSERYNQFKFFKKEILSECKAEIEEKSSLRFEFDLIKKQRVVQAITFTIVSDGNTNDCRIEQSIQESLSNDKVVETIESEYYEDEEFEFYNDEDEIKRKYHGDEMIMILAEAVDNEFDYEEMELIGRLLARIDIPKDENMSGRDARLYGKQRYLREQYLSLNIAEKKQLQKGSDIYDRCAYLIKMLKQAATDSHNGNF